MARNSKLNAASSRLEAAFNKSKCVFLEEAEDILRATLSSPTNHPSSSRGCVEPGINDYTYCKDACTCTIM